MHASSYSREDMDFHINEADSRMVLYAYVYLFIAQKSVCFVLAHPKYLLTHKIHVQLNWPEIPPGVTTSLTNEIAK